MSQKLSLSSRQFGILESFARDIPYSSWNKDMIALASIQTGLKEKQLYRWLEERKLMENQSTPQLRRTYASTQDSKVKFSHQEKADCRKRTKVLKTYGSLFHPLTKPRRSHKCARLTPSHVNSSCVFFAICIWKKEHWIIS